MLRYGFSFKENLDITIYGENYGKVSTDIASIIEEDYEKAVEKLCPESKGEVIMPSVIPQGNSMIRVDLPIHHYGYSINNILHQYLFNSEESSVTDISQARLPIVFNTKNAKKILKFINEAEYLGIDIDKYKKFSAKFFKSVADKNNRLYPEVFRRFNSSVIIVFFAYLCYTGYNLSKSSK